MTALTIFMKILICSCYVSLQTSAQSNDTTDYTVVYETEMVDMTTVETSTEPTVKPTTKTTEPTFASSSTHATSTGSVAGSTDTSSSTQSVAMATEPTFESTSIDTSTESVAVSTEASSSTRPVSVTTKETEPQSSPAPPAYPKETYPDIIGRGTVFREIAIEVAVDSGSCIPSDSSTEEECRKLEESFEIFATAKYERVSGFSSMDISVNWISRDIGTLSEGISIPHTVFYKYNEMTTSDRMLSAAEIYDKTLGPSVEGEEITEDFTFTNCDGCETVNEITNLCDAEFYDVDCETDLEKFCENNVWVCQSPCAHDQTEDLYCTVDTALCTQRQSGKAVCSCQQSEDGWYIGAYCQVYIKRLSLILGVSIGGGLVLILMIILIICLCRVKKDLNEIRRLPYEKTNEAFLLGQNDLELDHLGANGMNGLENEAFSHSVQPGELDDDFKPNTGKRVSNPELEQVLHDRAKQSNKNKNSENAYFWGNLDNQVPASQNQLKRQSNNYQEQKPTPVNRYGKNIQTSSIPPTDLETSDPFSNRYSMILRDDYGGLNNNPQ